MSMLISGPVIFKSFITWFQFS
uniref:Uncharacterized protein n=1 Tax=Rhizophora mucronata TaxID=61149 RepID=A0A2P2Q0R8_RHIMU